MKLTLYHGSKYIIDKPCYGKGKINNDYGLGFYCTFEKELAKEWSVSYRNNGFCNSYQFQTDNLQILHLNEYPCLVWLTILLENRRVSTKNPFSQIAQEYLLNNYLIDYKKYDVIYGYRADDSYFDFARSFLNNTIPLSYLESALRLGNLGNQYVLKSLKAFENLKFIEVEEVDSDDYYSRKIIRENVAKQLYSEGKFSTFNTQDIYIKDIIEKGLTLND